MNLRKIKYILAFLILFCLIKFTGASELLNVFLRLEYKYIFYLLLISAVLITISCIKWRLFIRAWGHDAPLLQLIKIYTITYFYNLFAPSYLMGDLARSFHLGKIIDNQKDAFVTTFLERFTGLLAMVLLGSTFVVLGTKITEGVELSILLVAFFVISAALALFSEIAYNLVCKIILKILVLFKLNKLRNRADKLFLQITEAMIVARSNQKLFAKAMFWSILFHFGTIINTYTAALAIGWKNPDFGGLCVTVPLVLLVSIAPITPSGIGIQEGAFMYFLQKLGATQAESLGVGLVLRGKNIITAVVGWLLLCFSLNKDNNKK